MGLLVVFFAFGCATTQNDFEFKKDTVTVCTGHSPKHLTCQEYVI